MMTKQWAKWGPAILHPKCKQSFLTLSRSLGVRSLYPKEGTAAEVLKLMRMYTIKQSRN